jgi:hypothetical protein
MAPRRNLRPFWWAVVTGRTRPVTSNERAPGRVPRNGLDDHGFSGLRLRTARERDASRALPQCVATVPLKASRGTTSYYMPVQPEQSLRPFAGRAPAHLRSLRAHERSTFRTARRRKTR